MITLDMRTVLLGYAISNAICLSIIYSLWSKHRHRSPAFDFWLGSFVLQFFSMLMFSLRDVVPEPVAILLGVPTSLVGVFLLYRGLCEYLGQSCPQRQNQLLLSVLIGIHVYFLWVQPSLQIRGLNFTLGLLLLFGQIAWLLLHRIAAPLRASTSVLGWITVAYCVVSLGRIFVALLVESPEAFYAPGQYLSLLFLVYQMLGIGMAFALLLLVNNRLLADLESDLVVRKRIEADLLNHRNHLEETVALRTADLSVAKEAAEAANVAKSAFLANMSHELRTPLHQMKGLVTLVRLGPLSAKQIGYLDKLDLSGKRLTGIIDTILQLTDIEAKRIKLAAEPADIRQLVTEAVETFRGEADTKGLRLVLEQCDLPPRLLCDPALLRSALNNYIGNALRFTEAGGVSVRVEVAEEDEEGVLLRCAVEDTGSGIKPDVLPRLFSIFEQVDNSSTRKYGGTGLGLAMTKKLAQLMGGDVGCTSTPNVGSTFWFTATLRKA